MRAISNLRAILWLAGLISLQVDEVLLSEAGAAQTSSQVFTNVAQFCRSANTGARANYRVQLEGVICWVEPTGNLFILRDDSGAVSISIDFGGAIIRWGKRVRVEGDCTAQRSGLGFVMTQALVGALPSRNIRAIPISAVNRCCPASRGIVTTPGTMRRWCRLFI